MSEQPVREFRGTARDRAGLYREPHHAKPAASAPHETTDTGPPVQAAGRWVDVESWEETMHLSDTEIEEIASVRRAHTRSQK